MKSKEVTIIKIENMWNIIRKNNSSMGSCSSLKKTVDTCNLLDYVIMNIDYVLTELINNGVK